jgi:radical SAM protein with 4Fe4S-binding SPASM domain
MTVTAGDVRTQSFGEIWRTAPVLQALRDREQLKGRCGRCEFNALCGGCRCRAYAAYGDYLEEDPACTYQPTGRPLATERPAWSAEARARLERIPIAFIRDRVAQGLEAYARRSAIAVITPDVMKAAMAGMERPAAFPSIDPEPS